MEGREGGGRKRKKGGRVIKEGEKGGIEGGEKKGWKEGGSEGFGRERRRRWRVEKREKHGCATLSEITKY